MFNATQGVFAHPGLYNKHNATGPLKTFFSVHVAELYSGQIPQAEVRFMFEKSYGHFASPERVIETRVSERKKRSWMKSLCSCACVGEETHEERQLYEALVNAMQTSAERGFYATTFPMAPLFRAGYSPKKLGRIFAQLINAQAGFACPYGGMNNDFFFKWAEVDRKNELAFTKTLGAEMKRLGITWDAMDEGKAEKLATNRV